MKLKENETKLCLVILEKNKIIEYHNNGKECQFCKTKNNLYGNYQMESELWTIMFCKTCNEIITMVEANIQLIKEK